MSGMAFRETWKFRLLSCQKLNLHCSQQAGRKGERITSPFFKDFSCKLHTQYMFISYWAKLSHLVTVREPENGSSIIMEEGTDRYWGNN